MHVKRRRALLVIAALAIVTGALVPTMGASARTEACVANGTASITGPGLLYPGLGSVSANFAVGFFGICLVGSGLTATGTIHGYCGLATAAGVTGQGDRFSMIHVGDSVLFFGDLNGYGSIEPNVLGGSSCFTGAWQFLITFAGVVLTSSPTTTSTSVPLPTLPTLPTTTTSSTTTTTTTTVPTGPYPSDDCTGGTVVADGFAGPAYVKLRTQAVDAQTTWTCIRVDGPAVNFGGKFIVTSGSASPGVPTTDDSSSLCQSTTPNTVPGPHPLLGGAAGDPADPWYTQYLLDTYATTGQAWLCVRRNGTQKRVVIPVTGAQAPTTQFLADPAGAHVPTETPAPTTPSGSCQSGVGGSKQRLANANVAGTQVWASTWQPSSTQIKVCARVQGPSNGGGVLTVDTSQLSGAAPTVTTSSSDITPCNRWIVQNDAPAQVWLKRSDPPQLPVSVCLVVQGTTLRVTVSAGTGNPAAAVTWTSDPP